MKNKVLKLFTLMIALALMLSGCNLIKIDPVMQAEDDLEALKKQYSTVIASYDGGEITIFDAMYEYAYNLSSMYYYYSYFNMPFTEAEDEQLKLDVLTALVRQKAIVSHAEEYGVSLDETELADVNETTATNYEEQFGYAYESAVGENDEAKKKNAEVLLYQQGFTLEALEDNAINGRISEKVEEAVKAEITEVTEEELLSEYETRVSEAEDGYASDISSFGSDMTSGNTVYFVPEGYRTVKHILLKPDEALLTAVNAAKSTLTTLEGELIDLEAELAALNDDDAVEGSRTAEEINADIAAKQSEITNAEAEVQAKSAECMASVQDKIDDINERLQSGESFDALIAEYGEDPGMQNEPTMTTGYYVSAESNNWDMAFKDAAMLLTGIGDVSEPVLGASGVHIIRYEADATPGVVALEDVREALTIEKLEEKQQQHFDEVADGWAQALNPVYSLDKWVTQE